MMFKHQTLLYSISLLALVSSFDCISDQAATFYKCEQGNKIVFSQQPCPREYHEHRLDYKYGVTTVTDSQEHQKDPIQQLLENQTLTQDEFVRKVDQEVFRLQQSNSYLELLRTSELKKLDRQRFWKKQEKDAPEYVRQVQQLNNFYDMQIGSNNNKVDLLLLHKQSALAVDQHN